MYLCEEDGQVLCLGVREGFCAIHPDADTVEWLAETVEEVEQGCARPGCEVDLSAGFHDRLIQPLLKDLRSLYVFVSVAQVKAMRILPLDLRTHAHSGYVVAYGPCLNCFAQPSAYAESAMALLHD